ncbi:MAG: hypothetical protein SFX72_04890 [Isosphaeraceae bacterium]|nr:hypothetical protein [Isosphaeraceae bacterium]
MALLQFVNGYKTYIAAVGLLGLAVYELSMGDVTKAAETFLAALAAAGLRHAVEKKAD